MLWRIFQRNESYETIPCFWVVSTGFRESVVGRVFVSREKSLGTSNYTVASRGHVLEISWLTDRRKMDCCTNIVCIVILRTEVVGNCLGDTIFQIRGTLGQDALRCSFDVRSQKAIIVWFFELSFHIGDQHMITHDTGTYYN